MIQGVGRLTRKLVAAAAVASCGSFLSGCNQNVDLDSIRTFTNAALQQQGAFADLAADFYGSCQRDRLWRLIGSISPQPASVGPSPEEQQALVAALQAKKASEAAVLAALQNARASSNAAREKQFVAEKHRIDLESVGATPPKAEPNAVVTPAPAASATPVPALLTVEDTHDPCQLEADAADQWQKANIVLLNYVRALGNLAGSKDGSTDTFGFDALASGLTGSKALNAAQADAFKTGASELASDIFAAKRRDAIAFHAAAADAVLSSWIVTLENVANNNYRGVLDAERHAVNHFFEDNFAASEAGLPALESIQYKGTWKDELTQVDARVTALNAYVQALEALRSAHHAMVMQSKVNGFSDVASIVNGYVSEVQPELVKIHAAFGPNTNQKP
jgi:hypothetical protein